MEELEDVDVDMSEDRSGLSVELVWSSLVNVRDIVEKSNRGILSENDDLILATDTSHGLELTSSTCLSSFLTDLKHSNLSRSSKVAPRTSLVLRTALPKQDHI